jgi:RHS repeat-associated protein
VSSTFCLAIDGSGYSATYTGSWATATDVDGSTALESLTCVSSSYCVASDGSGDVLTYNGSAWSYPTSVDATRSVASVSCASATFCAAVDASGYADVFAPVVIPPIVSQLNWDTNGSLALVLGDSNYYYIYGPSSAPVEQINLATSTATYLTYSPTNSTWITTNEAGDETGFYGFDAFGTLAFGAATSPFGYAGQYTDASSGFSNLRARFYDSQTGLLTTRDPAFTITDTAYTYAGGDPVNDGDPTGLCNSGVANSYYPGPCASTAAETMAAAVYIQSHISSGGFDWGRAWDSLGNYGAGVANGIVSTLTLGFVHVPAPFCNSVSFAYGLGSGFGYATAAVGLAVGGAALLRLADLSESPLVGARSQLFGRGIGLLNSNNLIRLGWGWSAPANSVVFRLSIGSAGALIHWHLDLF